MSDPTTTTDLASLALRYAVLAEAATASAQQQRRDADRATILDALAGIDEQRAATDPAVARLAAHLAAAAAAEDPAAAVDPPGSATRLFLATSPDCYRTQEYGGSLLAAARAARRDPRAQGPLCAVIAPAPETVAARREAEERRRADEAETARVRAEQELRHEEAKAARARAEAERQQAMADAVRAWGSEDQRAAHAEGLLRHAEIVALIEQHLVCAPLDAAKIEHLPRHGDVLGAREKVSSVPTISSAAAKVLRAAKAVFAGRPELTCTWDPERVVLAEDGETERAYTAELTATWRGIEMSRRVVLERDGGED